MRERRAAGRKKSANERCVPFEITEHTARHLPPIARVNRGEAPLSGSIALGRFCGEYVANACLCEDITRVRGIIFDFTAEPIDVHL